MSSTECKGLSPPPPNSKESTANMGSALTLWGDTGEALPLLDYVCQNSSWFQLLPAGCEVIRTSGHGSSLWSQAGRIDVRLQDGTEKSYFIKHSETDVGRRMSEGEFESMKELYKVIPESVPRPIGWGTYEGSKDLHFFLTSFINIHDELYPSMEDISQKVAEMHVKSQDLSPNGLFGFQVTTHNGTTPQYTKWTESWEEFYTESLRDLFRQAAARRPAPCPELDALIDPLLEKVVPRLLRPMETGGNTIRPSLNHGDLWHGNTARFQGTGKVAIFDACALWAHHEYDLHNWRGGSRFIFDKQYMKEYFKHNPPSEPRDEWEDRSDLYFISSLLLCAIPWYNSPRYRNECIGMMKALIAKFGVGYTGPHPRKGSQPVVDNTTKRTDSALPVGATIQAA